MSIGLCFVNVGIVEVSLRGDKRHLGVLVFSLKAKPLKPKGLHQVVLRTGYRRRETDTIINSQSRVVSGISCMQCFWYLEVSALTSST